MILKVKLDFLAQKQPFSSTLFLHKSGQDELDLGK